MAFCGRPPLLLALLCCSCVPSFSSSQLQRTPIIDDGRVSEGGLVRRVVAEVQPSSGNAQARNGSFTLAADRTHRKDPINGFKRYAGGWDIKNVHYWASVGFTAAPLFAIALAWFVLFGLFLLLACCCHYCCQHRCYSYSRTAYVLSLILLVAFTCAAITGCAILYKGQGKFHGIVSETLEFVIFQVNTTVEDLRNFASSLAAAEDIGVDQVELPAPDKAQISDLKTKVDSAANILSSKALENSDQILDLLNKVGTSLIVISAVMLILAFLGFLFSIYGLTSLVSFLAVVGWIFVTGTFILCGVFLLLHNVVTDSCVAMDEWVAHPREHSALNSIIPCADVSTANQSFYESKEYTSKLVNIVNMIIINVSNKNFPPGFPLYYNQSGPPMPILCDPFTPDLNRRPCVTGEVNFSNARQAWKGFICQTAVVSGTEICITIGRITPAIYQQMAAAVNVSQGLYLYGPFLKELQDCSFVREAFSTISTKKCPDLELYSKWTYVGLVTVSAAVMLSLLFWVIYARERRHRKYGQQSINWYGRSRNKVAP